MLGLASVAHALVQPDVRAAWLATLRAPWCGLTLADLFALVAGCGGESLCKAVVGPQAHEAQARLSVDGRSRLPRFTPVRAPALGDPRPLPLPRMVAGAWLAPGG